MATSVIRSFIAKALFKKKGAIANKKAVEFSAKALEQRLINLGIDPDLIRSEQELNQILNLVKQAEDQAFNQQFGNMLAGSRFDKPADVLDMTGKKIDPSKGIMGGKELTDSPLDDLKSIVEDFKPIGDQPPPGSRGGKDDIAAPFQSSDESLKNMIEAENKAAAERIRNKKMVKDAVDNMSPTFVKGDRKYNAQMVAEDLAEKKFNKDFYDLDQRQQIDIYGEALDGLDDSDKFAQGGRAGFKAGLGKRFLDLLKGKPKPKFDEKRFREGPIDLDFLENIDKKDLEKFIRTRDTMGPGGYGMYDNFADMPAGLRAAELIKTIKGPRNEINYKAAELFLGKKLKGNETANELIQMLNRQEMRADGGRIGYADGTPSFEEYMQERQGIEKKQNFERLYKEYLEDLRKKGVMEQKQMAADGGRIGLKAGMTKRAFLKLMGGTGAAIGAAKSGIFSGFGKGAGKQVAKEVVEQSVRSTPPPYFFELASKIKTLGKPDKITYADRVEIHRYRGKNGDEYELIEDLSTGDVRITKDKTGIGSYGDKTFDTIEDRTVLEYKKGDADVDPESGTAFKEADEYEEYKVEFDADGTPADATELDAVVQKEIIEEATGDAPSIKKAGGGIARMLGE